jgi:hypothetical protein
MRKKMTHPEIKVSWVSLFLTGLSLVVLSEATLAPHASAGENL